MDYFQFLINGVAFVFLLLVLGFSGYFLFRAVDSLKEKKYGGVIFWFLALIAILLFIWIALPLVVENTDLIKKKSSSVDVVVGWKNH
ncbi:MAG TPA: hypothetical protein VKP03_03135 [Patescibacteria group bacterium]|nr:hypothetical protein [Patescibacteria group bacterium]